MLGRLAKRLRLAGFDTAYEKRIEDAERGRSFLFEWNSQPAPCYTVAMTRRFLLVLLITCVAVLSGRSLLICTMNMAAAAQAPASHCPKHAAPVPAATDCMVKIDAPSGLPSVDQSATPEMVHAVAYHLAPVLILAPQRHAALRFEPVAFESPPASIQILRI